MTSCFSDSPKNCRRSRPAAGTLPGRLGETCIIVLMAGSCGACGSHQVLPVGLEVRALDAVRVTFDGLVGFWTIAADADRATWVFATLQGGPEVRVKQRGAGARAWVDVPGLSIPAAGGRFLYALAQGSRGLLVLWAGSEPNAATGRGRIHQARWDGAHWAERGPVPQTVAGELACCRDAQGVIHVVYLGVPEPFESYRVGPDSDVPQKPFHLASTDNGWTAPVLVGAPGRWHYFPEANLTPDATGGVYMCIAANTSSSLDYGPRVIELRALKDGKWSQPERVADPDLFLEMVDPSVAIGSNGDLHLVYGTYHRPGCGSDIERSRYRTRHNGMWRGPESIGRNGFRAVVGNDRLGRVHLCWQEGLGDRGQGEALFLRVWDTRHRSETIRIPGAPDGRAQVFDLPDGSLCLAWTELNKTVVIQPLVVEARKGDTKQASGGP